MSLSLEDEVERYLTRNPDAGVPELAGALSIHPEEAAGLLESPPVEVEDSSNPPKSPTWGAWSDANWKNTASGVYPETLLERGQWMLREKGEKTPYAPWSDKDAPAPCSNHDRETTCAECTHSARYKWGWSGNYRDGHTAEMAEVDPKIGGRVFLQTDADPFLFVDGDDVRCPESGSVHPAFIAILEHLGMTYADVSVSESGVHANYIGSFPDGLNQASWKLDADPWGENDTPPAIEIYPGKHVCVMTGKRVQGSAKDVHECDEDALAHLVRLNDSVAQSNARKGEADGPVSASFDDNQIKNHNPDATESDETTDDIKDVFKALNMLDARWVAKQTIVASWNDDVNTSGDNRAFYPEWGGSNCSGRANIVDRDKWQDTGDEGGYGGPVVMALIGADRFDFDETDANPSDVKGDMFWKGVEQLRELGYEIPRFEGHNGKHKDAARVFVKTETKEEERRRALRAMRASE